MKPVYASRFVPAALTICLAMTACAPESPETATLPISSDAVRLFHGGTIHTGDPDVPEAAIVVVNSDGRIGEVVSPVDAAGFELPTGLETIDLSGAVMFPGFTDAHAHLSGIGERELTLDLSGTVSLDELTTRIEAEVFGSPAGQLLVGRGWIETGWAVGRMPMAADLDAAAPDNPVILVRADGHALVANTAALTAAGITDDTPDPAGGRIERDEAGKATGILIDTAMGLVAPLMGTPSEADLIARLAIGAEVYAARGWTGMHNMSVSAEEAQLMERLDLEGRLPLRIHNGLAPEAFALAAQRAYQTDTITNRSVKLYMDGALGSRGAQLIAPYSDRPGETGLSLTTDAELRAFMARATRGEVQLAIHAIGDLANRRILDACEETGACDGKRWRVEHAQIIALEDLTRLAPNGLIASMQPSHAIGDLYFAPDRLGFDTGRLDGAYAWADLLAAGTVIAGGSDAPVEVGSPLIEFYAAVARAGLDGFQGEGWNPDQAVARDEALAMFTSAPAYASFQEDELGKIAPGYLADFTVFDRDLMSVPPREILEAEAVMTVIGGDIVWRAGE